MMKHDGCNLIVEVDGYSVYISIQIDCSFLYTIYDEHGNEIVNSTLFSDVESFLGNKNND